MPSFDPGDLLGLNPFKCWGAWNLLNLVHPAWPDAKLLPVFVAGPMRVVVLGAGVPKKLLIKLLPLIPLRSGLAVYKLRELTGYVLQNSALSHMAAGRA